jgi:hypothetical protein
MNSAWHRIRFPHMARLLDQRRPHAWQWKRLGTAGGRARNFLSNPHGGGFDVKLGPGGIWIRRKSAPQPRSQKGNP